MTSTLPFDIYNHQAPVLRCSRHLRDWQDLLHHRSPYLALQEENSAPAKCAS